LPTSGGGLLKPPCPFIYFFEKEEFYMPVTQMVAKAGVVREDSKVFDAKTLKMFAKESPEKYVYCDKKEELWLRKPEEKTDAHFS
jgi:hypothetical protein